MFKLSFSSPFRFAWEELNGRLERGLIEEAPLEDELITLDHSFKILRDCSLYIL
jgi:hypothetical protein